MAYFFSGQSHTFNEYLLVPGYSSSECIPDNVSLRTPLTRFRAGEEPALSLNVPMVSAVMQSVSGDRLAVALAQEGGVSFLYGSQSIEDEAAMVARVKSYKAGFVRSDSNISPDATLSDILALREQTGHSTVAVTEDGTADGRLVGIVIHLFQDAPQTHPGGQLPGVPCLGHASGVVQQHHHHQHQHRHQQLHSVGAQRPQRGRQRGLDRVFFHVVKSPFLPLWAA